MSTLFISEFSDLPITSNGVAQAPAAQDWIADQTVSITGTSEASNAFNPQTRYIVITADASCSIAWTMAGAGSVNAATAGNLLIPANAKPQVFGVSGGMKVSAISNS